MINESIYEYILFLSFNYSLEKFISLLYLFFRDRFICSIVLQCYDNLICFYKRMFLYKAFFKIEDESRSGKLNSEIFCVHKNNDKKMQNRFSEIYKCEIM